MLNNASKTNSDGANLVELSRSRRWVERSGTGPWLRQYARRDGVILWSDGRLSSNPASCRPALLACRMTSDSVPDDIRELVVKSIDSVAQLEALLFLRGHSEVGFDVGSLARELFAPEPAMDIALARLQRDGFIKQEQGLFRFDAGPALSEKVDRLAASYRRHLVPITNLIHSKPSAARSFSEAFRFRKE
jgi:hypothetical protein